MGAPDSGPHDFSDYLQQVKAWDLVMAQPDPLGNNSTNSTASPLKHSQSGRKREPDPEARDLRSVPSIFFDDGFDIEDPDTFHSACPIRDGSEVQSIRNLERHHDKVRWISNTCTVKPLYTGHQIHSKNRPV